MKKILWLCNQRLSTESLKETGTWTAPLARELHDSKLVDVVYVTVGDTKNTIIEEVNGIKQWLIPNLKTCGYGQIANEKSCKEVLRIANVENPDIIHIWGVESFWGSLMLKGYINKPCIIEIQGILSSYYHFYYGGMKMEELFNSIHTKEILMPNRTLFNKKNIFRKRGEYEKKVLQVAKYINIQSTWAKEQVMNISNNAQFFNTSIILRPAFYSSSPWKLRNNSAPRIFTSASAAIPYKGMHIAIKAIAELKKYYPNTRLYIAGNMIVGNHLIDGYSIYLKRLIKKYDLIDNIKLLGPLDENQIVEQLHLADVCLIPSFVETFCLAFTEAMMVGTPTVVAYSGAMPELARDRVDAVFYNPMDYISCSQRIKMLYENKVLAQNISTACRNRRFAEQNPTEIVRNQIKTYMSIIDIEANK